MISYRKDWCLSLCCAITRWTRFCTVPPLRLKNSACSMSQSWTDRMFFTGNYGRWSNLAFFFFFFFFHFCRRHLSDARFRYNLQFVMLFFVHYLVREIRRSTRLSWVDWKLRLFRFEKYCHVSWVQLHFYTIYSNRKRWMIRKTTLKEWKFQSHSRHNNSISK